MSQEELQEEEEFHPPYDHAAARLVKSRHLNQPWFFILNLFGLTQSFR